MSSRDKILYYRMKQKDREAFIEAYDLYLDSIYRFIFFKVRGKETAEDLTSQVFLKTWNYIRNNRLKDYKTLKSLLYKVARNLVIDHYRKESRKQEISYDRDESPLNLPDEKPDPLTEAMIAGDIKIVEEKLQEIKDEYREVIVLRYINELSTAEIAEVLEKTRGNVRVMIYRGLKTLREIMEQNK